MAPEKLAQEKEALGKNGIGKNGTKCRLGKNGTSWHMIELCRNQRYCFLSIRTNSSSTISSV